MKEAIRYLYRYERQMYNPDDGGTPAIYLCKFDVIRDTAKCYFINRHGSDKRVSKTAKSRFAYPTVDEALQNFKKRTERCMKIQDFQYRTTIAFNAALKNGGIRFCGSANPADLPF